MDDDQLALFSDDPTIDPSSVAKGIANENSTEPPHMDRPRKSLAQMAEEAQRESTSGKIICPHCGCVDFRTTNTKVVDGFRKRLRRCRHCGYPVNTIEFVLRD